MRAILSAAIGSQNLEHFALGFELLFPLLVLRLEVSELILELKNRWFLKHTGFGGGAGAATTHCLRIACPLLEPHYLLQAVSHLVQLLLYFPWSGNHVRGHELGSAAGSGALTPTFNILGAAISTYLPPPLLPPASTTRPRHTTTSLTISQILRPRRRSRSCDDLSEFVGVLSEEEEVLLRFFLHLLKSRLIKSHILYKRPRRIIGWV